MESQQSSERQARENSPKVLNRKMLVLAINSYINLLDFDFVAYPMRRVGQASLFFGYPTSALNAKRNVMLVEGNDGKVFSTSLT